MRVISSVVKASKKPWDTFWQWIINTEPKICAGVSDEKCKKKPKLLLASRLWLYWNENIEKYADVRFRVEDVSPRDTCRLANFSEQLCGSDGRYHTTSSKVIQPIVEPKAPADGHTTAENLAASWSEIEKLDPKLAEAMKAMTQRYGYHLDPAMHPQSLSTEAFRAGGKDQPGGGGILGPGAPGMGGNRHSSTASASTRAKASGGFGYFQGRGA